jgi:putative tryptophan/tyrosine transport system substrate-binding protein
MDRRRFLLTSLAGALAAPLGAEAQQAGKVYRIRLLGATSNSAHAKGVEALRAGLRDLGYVEGQNIVIEYRWAEGKYDRLPNLVAELVALKVEVIVTTGGTPPALAAKHATTTIPIVTTGVGDAVGAGLVVSLARPGGNITGLTDFVPELHAKRLELLKEAVPRIGRVAFLVNPDNRSAQTALDPLESTARLLKVELQKVEYGGPTS